MTQRAPAINRTSITPNAAALHAHVSFTQWLLSFSNNRGRTIVGQRIQPTAAEDFAPADLLQGILVISSFGFWAVMLGLMPVLAFRVWLAG